ncbi:DUF4192 domain-containing protein [Kineosporia rhizophila]|uniref:DUF4192 domain-containing protein n=1 Tax=Kineosporia TaxID=49184 RepID=UPI001E332A62|nr:MULTISPECIES: DUF4192 domain-containing protein [Kineosporia]MCE0539870.1 DUF4192 domain-containing protein [Kineosporia rhizophila]
MNDKDGMNNSVPQQPSPGPAGPRPSDLLEIHQALVGAFEAIQRSGDLFVVADGGRVAAVMSIPLQDLTAGPDSEQATRWSRVLEEDTNGSQASGGAVEQLYVFAYSAAGQEFVERVREQTEARGWHIVYGDETGCIDTTATPAVDGPTPGDKVERAGRSVLDRRLAAVEHARALLAANPGEQELPREVLAAVSEALTDTWIQFGCLNWDDDAAVALWTSVAASGPAPVRPTADTLLAGARYLRGQLREAEAAFLRAREALVPELAVTSFAGLLLPAATLGQRQLRFQQQRLLFLVSRMVLELVGKDGIPALIDDVVKEHPLD